jgi:hypothetical protein
MVRTVPRFRLVGENLFVGVGHKKVVELFAKKNTPEKIRPGPTASVPEAALGGGWDSPPSPSRSPASMPLDEGPAPLPESMPLDDGPLPPAEPAETPAMEGPLSPKVKEVIRGSLEKLWAVLHEVKSTAPCEGCGLPFLATNPARTRATLKLARLFKSDDRDSHRDISLANANLAQYFRIAVPLTESSVLDPTLWGLIDCSHCGKRLRYRCRTEAAEGGCAVCAATVAADRRKPDLQGLVARLEMTPVDSAEALNEQLDEVLWSKLQMKPDPCGACGLGLFTSPNQVVVESSLGARSAFLSQSWLREFALVREQTARYLRTEAPPFQQREVRNVSEVLSRFDGILTHMVLEKCPQCGKLVCRRCHPEGATGCDSCASPTVSAASS